MLSLIKNSLSLAIRPHMLESLLNKIERTEKEYFDSNMVYVDSIITVKDLVSNQEHCYQLSIPGYVTNTSRCLSILSPLGSELIGRRVGDEFTVKENGKYYLFKIIHVKNKILK
ncbi:MULTISPECIES: GreA/GreB family elongation factor [unclassified Photobacterium]|uniref:GreA/GreB family elongation factor n=1 Tax=unclassified Photobacterium TaxID=2628852 RepID=UPI001EE0D38C|nr:MULTISPECIES: GreA/GreB family elongation factor [unclassified Photobacterium]MCG3864790.1 GreA/GreB family elongation factor [Photobacterium sp. Ph6]MCG3876214.1 GreA/GreB family elongation factor [Photobacterium sp. Ph5]